jgi:uncharacterized membrane protein YphA (DoxX/SURF4 family)
MIVLAALLAAAFVVSAITKIADRTGTTRSFETLGLPSPHALAVAVPVVELVVAVALVVVPGLGAALALGLLSGFTTFLVLARRRGVDADCGCFGPRFRSSPRTELLRNVGMGAVALAVLLTA